MLGIISGLFPSRRFSLARLLTVALFLAPPLLGLRIAVKHSGGSSPEAVSGFGIYVFGFAFAFAMTFISYSRRLRANTSHISMSFWWCLSHGVLFSVVGYSLFFIPIVIKMWMNAGHALEMLGYFLLVITVPSPVIGAAAGGILGFFLAEGGNKPLPTVRSSAA